ncbi:MAG: 30S ribosomal protein S7, partial [Candidatus Aenigmatarchaeota archaeon]
MVLVFGRWGTDGIEVRDKGLQEYLGLSPVKVPSTGGKWAKKRFGRRKYSVVERLVNKVMVTGHIKASKKHIF